MSIKLLGICNKEKTTTTLVRMPHIIFKLIKHIEYKHSNKFNNQASKLLVSNKDKHIYVSWKIWKYIITFPLNAGFADSLWVSAESFVQQSIVQQALVQQSLVSLSRLQKQVAGMTSGLLVLDLYWILTNQGPIKSSVTTPTQIQGCHMRKRL